MNSHRPKPLPSPNSDMADTRRRTIVRRGLLAAAGVVLTMTGYLGLFGASCWLYGRGLIDEGQHYMLHETVFAPMQEGGQVVQTFGDWCFIKGLSLDWDDFKLDEKTE